MLLMNVSALLRRRVGSSPDSRHAPSSVQTSSCQRSRYGAPLSGFSWVLHRQRHARRPPARLVCAVRTVWSRLCPPTPVSARDGLSWVRFAFTADAGITVALLPSFAALKVRWSGCRHAGWGGGGGAGTEAGEGRGGGG
jgi:hypothetical protein